MSPTSSTSDLTGTGSHACDTLLRLVADTVPVMLAYYDAHQLRCSFANQRFADYVGRALDSLPGTLAQEVLDSETCSPVTMIRLTHAGMPVKSNAVPEVVA